ncbi:hypothetical protein [Pseudomonas sp. HY13-MNA-CIBAN-0226]|uniref:hypothetical protein n=1 Tax=Pseudomonas sp. HY13-MNA-CIBAN-0226 TaxID=3140473 RepID=UPI00331C0673
MPEIKERPILFSAPMVRAILEGQKTVTRREVKKRAALDCLAAGFEPAFLALPGNADLCPYGKPGDRLWVRETFNRTNPGGESGIYYYRADGKFPKCIGGGRFTSVESWKPSIHMPRAASRILLEVAAVRVERLQDISEEQAIAEGCQALEGCKWHTFEEAAAGVPMHDHTALDAFEALWEGINGEESWASNPWVWVVEFKQVTP